MNKLIRWLRNQRAMHKKLSRDGRYYYIEELSLEGRGWLAVESDQWLPFAFWEVKSGVRTKATKQEIERYQRAMKR